MFIMPAIDSCEPPILRALQKDGWHVFGKPHLIYTDEHHVFADFSLQRVTEDQMQQIVIAEVKCFSNPQDDLQELYTAIGQYIFYRSALLIMESSTLLYLAIPVHVYTRLSDEPAVLLAFRESQIKVVIVDVEAEEVIQWLN